METRSSFAKSANKQLVGLDPKKHKRNSDVFSASGVKSGVLLIGGTSSIDFQIRVAQRRMRNDMMPSFWSEALLFLPGRELYGISLNGIENTNEIAKKNAISRFEAKEYYDARKYPNIALIAFSLDDKAVMNSMKSLMSLRNAVDLPGMLVPWLGYLWGLPEFGNPLKQNISLPSAAAVESAYADTGVDITPGLSSEASCPEVIWQAAKWWYPYYKEAAGHSSGEISTCCVPYGCYLIRQTNPSIYEPGVKLPQFD